MSALSAVVANQAEVTDIAARIMRLRDHLVGDKHLDNPSIATSQIGGVLGEIENAVARNAVVTHFAIDALNEIEAALGLAN